MKKSILSLLIVCVGLNGLTAQNTTSYPFQDPSKSVDEHVADLVSRLTLEEKALQMMHEAPAVPRLGIEAYSWWNEALHGVARTGRATVFPQNIGLAATFDQSLIRRIGDAVSDEAWAKYNIAQQLNNHTLYSGITFYAPNINIFRDPRWGRGQETFGEDPYLTASMGVAYVKGMQGDNPKYLKTATCAKHYVVHSGPEALRHSFNAEIPMHDFYETYTPAFESLVKDGKMESVMCAYNRTFGKPCCASSFLLQDLLRKQWGFNGYITTDCWAVSDFVSHGAAQNTMESAVLAVKSGVNLCCGDEFKTLPEAVKQNMISEKEIDQALSVLLRTRFKLGLFDPINENPYSKINESVIGCQKHIDLAYEAAAKSLVLLQNNNNTLPLKKNLKTLYVVGPYAANQDVLLGNYNGVSDRMTTVLQAVVGKVSAGTSVGYRIGVEPSADVKNNMNSAVGEAQSADAVIAVFGISGVFEGEEGESIASDTRGDRTNLGLPQNQLDFLRKMKKSCNKPIILVLTGGSPICTEELKSIADAIIFVWYPGQEGGRAVADAIFGDLNPSGRLPITFPKSAEQLPPFEEYSMTGRTYRYMTQEPLFPFGFGLSYTQFQYDNLKLSADKIKKGKSLTLTADIANVGAKEGEEVVQLYLTNLKKNITTPLYALKGIKRINLKAGEKQQLSFEITPEMMTQINEKGEKVMESTDFKVSVGGCNPSDLSKKLGASDMVSTVFTVK